MRWAILKNGHNLLTVDSRPLADAYARELGGEVRVKLPYLVKQVVYYYLILLAGLGAMVAVW